MCQHPTSRKQKNNKTKKQGEGRKKREVKREQKSEIYLIFNIVVFLFCFILWYNINNKTKK